MQMKIGWPVLARLRHHRFVRAMLTSLLTFLAVAAIAFVALSALLYWRQESFIFFPRANDPLLVAKHQANRIEIRGAAGRIEGWWVDNPRAAHSLVILYFGGNAEDVLYTASTARQFDAQRMLVVNYRGYGRSAGQPGQQALYEDALAIYDHVVSNGGVKPDDIVVMGRSLGSGVASMLASERPVRGVILVTPFDTLTAVASHHYSFLPVRWLLRHPFPSTDWARRAQAPALILAAADDLVIPPSFAARLRDAWAGPSELHTLAGVGHNTIEQHDEYQRLINRFLAQLLSPGAPAHAQTPTDQRDGAPPPMR